MQENIPIKVIFTNARISSSLSIVSSLLIVIAIFRSQLKFTRIYNRIMLGISTMDIISSIPIPFTTLPIPIEDTTSKLPGAAGNIFTCNIQGFVANFGYMGSLLYSGGLTLYYFCRIQCKTSDYDFRKVREKVIHVVCVLIPCGLNIAVLLRKMFNPGSLTIGCTIILYPEDCGRDESIECIRGSPADAIVFRIIVQGLFILNIIFVTGSLLAIMIGACKTRRNFIYQRSIAIENQEQDKLRKELIRQALMYQLSFLIVWTNLIIRNQFLQNPIVNAITIAILPLQGFFNALIFFYHKVHVIRVSDPQVTVCQALYNIFFRSGSSNEIQLTGISKVEKNNVQSVSSSNLEGQTVLQQGGKGGTNQKRMNDKAGGSSDDWSGANVGIISHQFSTGKAGASVTSINHIGLNSSQSLRSDEFSKLGNSQAADSAELW